MECWAFLALCTYYCIWIPEYAIVAQVLLQILYKDVEFRWELDQKKAMKALKDALGNGPALKTGDVSNRAGQMVLGVDASLEGWRAILQQEEEENTHPACRYKCGLWNAAEIIYDGGKWECCGLLRALKMLCNYVYGVRFLVDTDVNTVVH
jgi:hypothetical protein